MACSSYPATGMMHVWYCKAQALVRGAPVQAPSDILVGKEYLCIFWARPNCCPHIQRELALQKVDSFVKGELTSDRCAERFALGKGLGILQCCSCRWGTGQPAGAAATSGTPPHATTTTPGELYGAWVTGIAWSQNVLLKLWSDAAAPCLLSRSTGGFSMTGGGLHDPMVFMPPALKRSKQELAAAANEHARQAKSCVERLDFVQNVGLQEL